ncbi:uncharacterized protein LOC132299955 isoform X2 [Cornus florida]|uniref:uncharacterized protein LOC132299955 isoform X2 n=1 Tax=Cornus florida TaxID=4283 RepID=UPI00289DA0F6|nr:uncharacterized protein LOC132299955 isoform X2 [Cornus florida]
MDEIRKIAAAYFQRNFNQCSDRETAEKIKQLLEEDIQLSLDVCLKFTRENAMCAYIVRSGRPFCDACGVFIKGAHFCCDKCWLDTQNGSSVFNICPECYGTGNYALEHPIVFDNYSLLKFMKEKFVTETESDEEYTCMCVKESDESTSTSQEPIVLASMAGNCYKETCPISEPDEKVIEYKWIQEVLKMKEKNLKVLEDKNQELKDENKELKDEIKELESMLNKWNSAYRALEFAANVVNAASNRCQHYVTSSISTHARLSCFKIDLAK